MIEGREGEIRRKVVNKDGGVKAKPERNIFLEFIFDSLYV